MDKELLCILLHKLFTHKVLNALYARGKRSKAISDRSGMEFPYTEMVKEWNGSFVHKSEFEAKHPQIKRKHIKADAIALVNPRPMHPDTQKHVCFIYK